VSFTIDSGEVVCLMGRCRQDDHIKSIDRPPARKVRTGDV
jgi:hypothetical protein